MGGREQTNIREGIRDRVIKDIFRTLLRTQIECFYLFSDVSLPPTTSAAKLAYLRLLLNKQPSRVDDIRLPSTSGYIMRHNTTTGHCIREISRTSVAISIPRFRSNQPYFGLLNHRTFLPRINSHGEPRT